MAKHNAFSVLLHLRDDACAGSAKPPATVDGGVVAIQGLRKVEQQALSCGSLRASSTHRLAASRGNREASMRYGSLALPILASFLPFACSCSSSYVPASSPRLSLVMDHGTYAYVRDGKKYEGGYFGGDIEEAVQGKPKAEEYARSYKTGRATGFALTLLGAAAAVGGLVLFGAQAGQTQSGQDVPLTGLLIAGGGLIIETIGSLIAVSAEPHLTDAINAYNDGVFSDAPSPPHAPPPPTTTPPIATTAPTAGVPRRDP